MTLDETLHAAEAAGAKRRNRQNTASKVIMLLHALAARPEGIGVRKLSRELGIDKSAVSRLFEQLVELGVASQDEYSGRFQVGPGLFALAATIHSRDTLWQAAQPIIHDLATAFNETCYLAVREGDQIVFREKVDTTHNIRYVIDAGEQAPLYAGAGGRAVLSTMSDAEIRALIKRTGLHAVTPNTITSIDDLLAQAHQDNHRGYSASHGERVVSGAAIAAPYFDADGACRGAIVFTCPAQRFNPDQEPDIAAAVVAAGRQLTKRLGFRE